MGWYQKYYNEGLTTHKVGKIWRERERERERAQYQMGRLVTKR